MPVHATTVTFTPAGGAGPVTLPIAVKAAQQIFEPDHGRWAGRLGVGHPQAGPLNPTTLPLGPTDPVTEVLFATDPAVPVGAPDRRHPALADQRQRPADRAAALRRLRRAGGQPGRLGRHAAAAARHGAGLEETSSGSTRGRTSWWRCARSPRRCRSSWATASGCSTRAARPGRAPGRRRSARRTGEPATVVNQLVNLGWEYRWHSQLAGHRDGGMSPAAGAAGGAEGPDRADRHTGARLGHRATRDRAGLDQQRRATARHQPPAATGHRRDLRRRGHHDHRRGRRHPVHRRDSHPRGDLPLPDPGGERASATRPGRTGCPPRCIWRAPSGLVATLAAGRAAAGGAALGEPVLRHRHRRAAGHQPDLHQRPGHHGDRGRRQPPGRPVAPDTTYYYRVRTTYLGAASAVVDGRHGEHPARAGHPQRGDAPTASASRGRTPRR